MKANELRIGNYVDVVNRSGEVHLPFNIVKKIGRISFFEVDLYDYDKPFATQNLNWTVDVKDLSPIPLTEEWLERFGFRKRINGSSTDWHIGTNPITHDWLFHLTWIEGLPRPNYRNGFHGVAYVHQLQNLYFALTGEELTIKL